MEQARELTFPLRSKTDVWRWDFTRAVPILDSGGKITRWFGTNTDIQDQKTAQERIKALHYQTERARAELYEFFMQAPAPMVVLPRPDHRIAIVNPPYERFMARKVVGKSIYENGSKPLSRAV